MNRTEGRWSAVPWALLAVALGLRLFHLGQNSLWIDEIGSLRIIAGPFRDVAEAGLRYNAYEPPLYFWLLDLAAQLWGTSEATVRLVSAVAGALTVPVVWLLTREVTRREDVAALCAGLLAINPLHIWYSQEARPYSLMVLFGSAALLFCGRALRSGSARHWAGFAFATALAMLSHVFGATAAITAGAWVLLHRDRAAAVKPLLLSSLAVAALIAPSYIPLAQAALSATETGSVPRPITGLEIPYTVFIYLGGYSFGPSQREIQDLGFREALVRNVGQIALAGALLGLALALAVRRRTSATLPFAILFAIPLVLTFVGAAVTTKPYNTRYPLLGLVGALAVLSVAIMEQPGRRRRAVLILLFCGVSLGADAQWYWVSRYWKEDSRTAVSRLAEVLPSGARIGVAPAYMQGALAHYARKEGVRLCIVGVDPDEDFTSRGARGAPDALLLSRLHHLPRWRQLERAFEQATGARPRADSIVGYRVLMRETPEVVYAPAGGGTGC